MRATGKDARAVVNNVHSLGRVAQRVEGFTGPRLGARLASRNERAFSAQQLAAGRATAPRMHAEQQAHGRTSAAMRESASAAVSRARASAAVAGQVPSAQPAGAPQQHADGRDEEEGRDEQSQSESVRLLRKLRSEGPSPRPSAGGTGGASKKKDDASSDDEQDDDDDDEEEDAPWKASRVRRFFSFISCGCCGGVREPPPTGERQPLIPPLGD